MEKRLEIAKVLHPLRQGVSDETNVVIFLQNQRFGLNPKEWRECE
jgi:hypothetical protein